MKRSAMNFFRVSETCFIGQRPASFFMRHGALHFQNKEHTARYALCFGATTGIRTRDLVITNDVLCQLSHSSAFCIDIISNNIGFVNRVFCPLKPPRRTALYQALQRSVSYLSSRCSSSSTVMNFVNLPSQFILMNPWAPWRFFAMMTSAWVCFSGSFLSYSPGR